MPVPTSPYHFYSRNGYQIREKLSNNRMTIEIAESFGYRAIALNESKNVATRLLNEFLARNPKLSESEKRTRDFVARAQVQITEERNLKG